MNKVWFTLRWSLTFAVLSAFTVASVSNIWGGQANALSANYTQLDSSMKGKSQYVVIDGETTFFSKNKTICTLNQQQLDIAKAQFGATIENVAVDGAGNVNVANIKKSSTANHGKIMQALGLSSSDCKAVENKHIFYFFLAPGIS